MSTRRHHLGSTTLGSTTLGGTPLRITRVFALTATLAALSGCEASRRSEPIAGPLPAMTKEQANGQIMFMRKCNACHPQGEGGVGGTLNNKPFPSAVIKLKVRTGLGLDMPTFSTKDLSDADLDDVAAYLKLLRKQGE